MTDAQSILETALVEAEGLPLSKDGRARPYKDSKGLWTIGIGTLISGEPALAMIPFPTLMRDGISVAEAYGFLRAHCKKDEVRCNTLFPNMQAWKVETPYFWAALMELSYNLGDLSKKWPQFTASVRRGEVLKAIREMAGNGLYLSQVKPQRFTRLISQLTYG